jgi:hypothetical protein
MSGSGVRNRSRSTMRANVGFGALAPRKRVLVWKRGCSRFKIRP